MYNNIFNEFWNNKKFYIFILYNAQIKNGIK